MGSKNINAPQNPQARQLAPNINPVDASKTPAGGIELAPFTQKDYGNKNINTSMQNVADLQRKSVDAYNQNIIQQQQKAIDKANIKINLQNQNALSAANTGQPMQNASKYKNNLNSGQMQAGQMPQQPKPINYSQYNPTPQGTAPQPAFLGRSPSTQQAKYKASGGQPVSGDQANPFKSSLFTNQKTRM